jgi:hypothetical protein
MLTRLDIFRLVVKFVGLLILAQALVILLFVLLQFSSELDAFAERGWLRDSETLLALVVGRFLQPVVYLLVGLAAIRWGNREFRSVQPSEPLDNPAETADLLSLEAMLYFLLGTYLIIEGITRILGNLSGDIALSLMNGVSIADQLIYEFRSGAVYASLAKIAFGIVLVLRRDGMAALRISMARWIKVARRWPN